MIKLYSFFAFTLCLGFYIILYFSDFLKNKTIFLREHHCNCTNCQKHEKNLILKNYNIIYNNILEAQQLRRQWSKNLHLFVETEHGRYPKKNDTDEQEYPFGRERFNLLGPVAPTCINLEKYGSDDGEKRACGLKTLLQNVTENCVFISLGSNNEWDFEVEIYNRFPHCTIEVFDCTVSDSITPPLSISSRTRLHHLCLGSKSHTNFDNSKFIDWISLIKMINVTSSPAYLKMDIEGFEYQVLRDMIDSGIALPEQIAFEIHYSTHMTNLPWHGRLKSSAEIALFMQYLYYEGNYFLIDKRINEYCPICLEILIGRLPSL